MTLEDALDALELEFSDLMDEESLRKIAKDIVTRAVNSAYNDGWAAGFADAIDQNDADWIEE